MQRRGPEWLRFPRLGLLAPTCLAPLHVEEVEVEEVVEVEERRYERRSAWRLAFSALSCGTALQQRSYLSAVS